ncbi:class I SAM-dependent methyltransferase [Enterococcus sp. BWB1-3]|uniref:class I SAM-dependent methyltransferase n=1 Tax=Enterococcus sp. BWB1-3 TaxID=2787713 RepID=UPI001921C101|nr:class I SAM-dependent methyltransferase [Enterococcus sp. BWB1-3]MBL1228104.1 class I SAM-dependent methyltransferase [Enterococcus sp. BWB1-3]
MFSEKMEKAFEQMEQAIQLLKGSLDVSFLDAYIENGDNILDNFQVRILDGKPEKETVLKLEKIYKELAKFELEPEELRRLSQLLLLKGNKEEPIQANHQLTPDSIGFLFVYLVEQLYPDRESLQILDIASGMGNLLLTILLNLKVENAQAIGYGVDIDDTLLSVASVNSGLTGAEVQLFHQDGIQDLLLEPVDTAVSDLPIGYYPNDDKVKDFSVSTSEGHSYAHHLLMEQVMKYVKPGGFGLFLVPSNLFESEQSDHLKKWIQEQVYLQGFIQLPDGMFQSEQSRKSILMVQNKGENSRQAKEVLLVKLASLKDSQKITQFFQQFEAWKSSNLYL